MIVGVAVVRSTYYVHTSLHYTYYSQTARHHQYIVSSISYNILSISISISISYYPQPAGVQNHQPHNAYVRASKSINPYRSMWAGARLVLVAAALW